MARLARPPTVTLNLHAGDDRFVCSQVAARLLSTFSWFGALSQRTIEGGGSDSFRSPSGTHPFTPEPLELRRHRSSGARTSDALKVTKTCRSFKNRSHQLGAKPNPSRLARRDLRRLRRPTTLPSFSVVVGLPEMRG